ncbi:MAG: ferrous iron transport protein B, partial [Anaerolineales bacterium]|nr:ferrous iron transport protein B [Anaerolineales bacterium]
MTKFHELPPLAPPQVGSKGGSALIALAGQPNMGKSTLFNLLTGLNQHVGNWPGKTVERREGRFDLKGRLVRIVDLPGAYSLTANSPEEIIAREFILLEKPDLVIAVVSAAHLERSLYLVAELLALGTPLVIGLNMMDVAEREGIRIEPHVLEAALGVPVVPMVAAKAWGVRDLLDVVEEVLAGKRIPTPRPPEIRPDHARVLSEIQTLISSYLAHPYPADWVALKLLEGDSEVTHMIRETLPAEKWERVHEILRAHDDAFLAVASGRYEWIGRMVRAAITRPRVGQIGLTERLDRWAAHPLWGLLLLAGILGLVFWLTFTVGTPLQDWLERAVVGMLAGWASEALAGAPFWIQGLIVDGLIGGVGSVLTFLPVLVIFFAAFALLEDVGYMARAAYVMDNLMHLMGLHGKSFLPLFLGFGCNVPAVMGTRVIDSWPARLLTILIAPLVPCTARMAVVAFIAPAFFGTNAVWVTWGLVL